MVLIGRSTKINKILVPVLCQFSVPHLCFRAPVKSNGYAMNVVYSIPIYCNAVAIEGLQIISECSRSTAGLCG